jgi:hypothetical protein
MRPLPRTTDTHRWYRVRGKRRPPRVIRLDDRWKPATPSEGKAREASRGSSPKGDVPTRTSQRRREGTGEGDVSRETSQEELAHPAQW